jgi:homocitrate synthase NifV
LFTVESGLHLAGLMADPATYEPYPPELTGAQRSWKLGAGAGRAAVTALVPEARRDPVRATAALRRAAAQRGRALAADEWRGGRQEA